ncbi:MAG: TA system VapC family ribonuclease toxin [Terriglobales bacterium]
MILLLDVNVLVALAWPEHEAHDRVQQWFLRKGRMGWATCPFTQAGFVRIVSNPSFSTHAVTPQEASRLLSANLNHPGHRFWRDEIAFTKAVQPFQARLRGHQQITDAYLLGLAAHLRGKLATLDERIGSLLAKNADWTHLEIIRA